MTKETSPSVVSHILLAQMKPVSHGNQEIDLDAICSPKRKLLVPLRCILANNPWPSALMDAAPCFRV